jgi:hypothetical protein
MRRCARGDWRVTNGLRADVHGSGSAVTLALFGKVQTRYREHGPASRERLPKQAARMRTPSPEQFAQAKRQRHREGRTCTGLTGAAAGSSSASRAKPVPAAQFKPVASSV